MNHLKDSVRNMEKLFGLHEEQLKEEMDVWKTLWRYLERFERWKDTVFKRNWLSSVFIYARYARNLTKFTGFDMKDCLSILSVGWKFFNSVSSKDDHPMYANTDRNWRHFVKQSININKNKKLKWITIETSVEKKRNFIGLKFSKLLNSKEKQQVIVDDFSFCFDPNFLHLTALSLRGSIYQKIETGFVFTNDMTDELVKRIISKPFGIENEADLLAKSGILKMTSYYPGHRNVENVPVKENVEKVEVSRLVNGNITDTSKSVDIQEIVKMVEQ